MPLRGRSGAQPAPSLPGGQLKQARSFLPVSVVSRARDVRTERCSALVLSPMGLGKFRQCLGRRWRFHDLKIRIGLPALRRLAQQRLCGLTPEADAGGNRMVRLRSRNSVALGSDGCAWVRVRGPGVVNQSPADHMKNAEPENKGRYQGFCAQSFPASELSAR
jgi:hypothetical protein